MNKLNSYGSNNDWNKWLLNINNKSVTFKVNNGRGFTFSSQLILLPSLAESKGHAFSGWFEDEEPTKFNKSSVENDTTLYGGWAYTVTFCFGNRTNITKTVAYGKKYGDLPAATKTGYTFIGWFTENNIRVTNETIANITEGDHTLYVHWKINNYTLTFDYRNGTITNETLNYNETIKHPESMAREGYKFIRWYNRPYRMPARDLKITAQWEEIATEVVEVTIGRKDMPKEDIENIVKRFTDKEFTIIRYDEDKDSGETIVIIKFNDVDSAKEFVDNAREPSSGDKKEVLNVRFSLEAIESGTFGPTPIIALGQMILCL